MMKAQLSVLIFFIYVVSGFAQATKVARTPALNYDWRPGFVSINEAGGGMGLAENTADYAKGFFGFTSVNGYQFSRNVKAGVGIGIQAHNNGTLFPLYLDFRYSFSAQEVVPYLSAAGGLALSSKDLNEQTRLFINPSVGVKYVAAKKLGVSLSSGLMIMSAKDYRSSFINFKLGIEIKGR